MVLQLSFQQRPDFLTRSFAGTTDGGVPSIARSCRLADKRVGGGRGDAQPRELAARDAAAEAHRREMLAVAEAGAFDQHRSHAADARGQRAREQGGAGFAQARGALVDQVAGHLRQTHRRSALPGYLGEVMEDIWTGPGLTR